MAAVDDQPPDSSVHVRTKWRLIGVFWLAQALFIAAAAPLWVLQGESVDGSKGLPLGVLEWTRISNLFTRPDFLGSVALIIGVLMVLQAVLVWPVRKPIPRTKRGWPLWLSLGVGALAGSVLAISIVFAIIALFMLEEWSVPMELRAPLMWAFWIWCGGSYIVGFVLMRRFCIRGQQRGQRLESLLARIASTLFIGTLVESVAIMPIDVMWRRRTDCYCFAGTFWAYTLLLAAGLVTLGPAILLPILARRRKRWYASCCDCCGYDMTGLIESARSFDRCPECGAGWRYEPSAQAEANSVSTSARAEGS